MATFDDAAAMRCGPIPYRPAARHRDAGIDLSRSTAPAQRCVPVCADSGKAVRDAPARFVTVESSMPATFEPGQANEAVVEQAPVTG